MKQHPIRISLAFLAVAVGFSEAATAFLVDVGFDSAEGYSADASGDLQGQPSAGNQWGGDVTEKIRVTSSVFQAGDQSVWIIPDLVTGKVRNYLDVGTLPNRFTLKFYWRPSGTTSGDAVVYLSQFGSDITTAVGPWIQFVASGTVYQIKYVENGTVKNIKLGMDPIVYAGNWWEVEIVGDLTSHTFDFYLDGTLEKSGLGFRNTFPADLATSLSHIGLQASNTGASDHYFDEISVVATTADVPSGSRWGRAALLILLMGSVLWWSRRRVGVGAA